MAVATPIVSIIVPAYNAEKYIHEAIQSVVDQTFQEWELLVVDDGSTDSTAKTINSFSDERIVLIQQKNAGVSSARNSGIELARGKYITFLDADDVLPSKSLEARVEYMEKHSEVDLVDGKIMIKDAEMKETIRNYVPYYNGPLLPRLMALDSSVFFNVCYMFKRENLGNIRFKEKMTHAEDLLFYMELSSLEHVKYGFVSEPIYWYRSGHASAMTNLLGLENGYLRLIEEVKKLQNISKIDFLIFKTKIAKIMFLSWLGEKEILPSIKSVFYMYQVISKDKI